MKYNPVLYIAAVLFALAVSGCSVSNNPQHREIKLLQKGKLTDDTSFVYHLPYGENSNHLVVQGYFSMYTHKHRAALDFKMKKGTKIFAARDGIVLRLKEDGDKGGADAKFRPYGNYVVIQHADSARTGYWHLQYNGVLVNVGDTVKQGQVIGLSGKTGYTYFPHLHFIVWKTDGNGKWTQIGTRFQTNKGIRYLRPLRFYRNSLPTKQIH
ncbi:MAG: M23 family metallopeptidase [Chitinophagaceae bacterium]|nr:M23 family metallopeptidase [Chitinophagaceae bacterium]